MAVLRTIVALLRWWLDKLFNYFIPEKSMGIQSWNQNNLRISEYRISEYTIANVNNAEPIDKHSNAGFVSRMESDTHADTTVAGKN